MHGTQKLLEQNPRVEAFDSLGLGGGFSNESLCVFVILNL